MVRTMKYAPIYDMVTAQPILHSTDIGNHQCNELGDNTMTITTNTIDLGGEVASVRLDQEELYRLYSLLHFYFKGNGGSCNHE